MKIVRGVLLVLLVLTCLMQVIEGLASIVNPAGMMAGLNLTMAPGVEVPLTFLGLAMIVRGAITAIAFVWIMKRKPEGLFLARFTAVTILLSAPVVYLKLHRVDFAIGDLVQGALLAVPALMVKSQSKTVHGSSALSRRLTMLSVMLAAATLAASDAYPPPRFTDPGRVAKLESAMPEIDRIFRGYATDRKIPGMIWGVVIDGRLAHVGTFGVRDRASHAPITPDTAFRIASMTKSFTALAVLKLRDDGRLSLEDPVSRWIGEFARMERPTRDTPPLTIRQLLSHSAGFPEDNPWGDQQLSATDAMLDEWLAKGIPFSTPPGTRYEYSNYAFGLLGRVVTKAAGVPYEQYVQTEILSKLHMDGSTFRFADVPVARRAIGYRLKPDGSYSEEAPLPHGVFGAMGGLLTTATDLGKYVAFHVSAWPSRDDEDPGPVRRSSVREMAHLWTPSNLTARFADDTLRASESGYGFGLRVTSDCRFEHIVAHGGGLPGFGSYMAWLPEYGVGMFAMATLTYSGPSEPISQAWDAMLKTGGLRKRELPPTSLQSEMRDHILSLWKQWNDEEAKRIAAVNFFLDAPSEQRQAEIRALKNEVGECTDAGPVMPENWMRGQFNMTCAKGTVGVFFTLAPTQPPAVQHLSFQKLASPAVRMGAPTGAPAGVSCTR